MNVAPASWISSAEWLSPSLNRIRMVSALLRKLSLKAEKNWHQNSGAKRRVVIRRTAMGFGSGAGASLVARTTPAKAGGKCGDGPGYRPRDEVPGGSSGLRNPA